MKRLTFDEFMKLPRKEQNRRYKDLSDHDKFLARISDGGGDNLDGKEPLSKEELLKIAKELGIPILDDE